MALIRPSARRGMAIALTAWSIASLCLADPTPPPTPSPHALVTAAEMLYQRKLPEACDLVLKLGLQAEDLTDSDRVRLQILIAMRQLDRGDKDAAWLSMGKALELDRDAQLPYFATDGARALLEDRRGVLPTPPAPRRDPVPPKPAVTREPAARPLFRAMDGMYQEMQLEAADAVLDLTGARSELSKEERAQVLLRKGILRMEADEEGRARTYFHDGLEMDRRAKLPVYVPPKTMRAFESVRASLPPEPTPPQRPPAGTKPPIAAQTVDRTGAGMIVGGTFALVGGTVVFLASGQPSDGGGRTFGAVLGLAGAALLTGGIVWQAQSTPLALRVNVAPTYQGGLVLASGRF